MFGLDKKTTVEQNRSAEQNTSAAQRTYLPAVDVAETETGYTIYADVPGATKDSVDVTYENGVVTLKARAEAEVDASTGSATESGRKVIHREFRRASYERSFRVGDDVDVEAIGAEIAQGVLKVTLPRKASAKKTISVK